MFDRFPYIVAELSGNHGGSLDKAVRMIYEAKAAGCDAVKIQTYEPEEMPDYAENTAIYQKSRTPREWYPTLFGMAKAVNIPLFSSVFSQDGVDFLRKFNCPAYKMASPESTKLYDPETLAWHIRRQNKPFVASTGYEDEIEVRHLRADFLLLCVAGYPATVTDNDLHQFVPTTFAGFSDHSADIKTPLAFIGAGAKIIEKHFKLDDDCIDAAFSFDPTQMAALCRAAHR